MRILAATFVLPISNPMIENGAVVVNGSKIIEVSTAAEIQHRYPEVPIEHFTDCALLPGLVNCHSHLEITAMRGALDDVEHDFTAWLIKLNEIRKGLSNDDIQAAALIGAAEGARGGATCFGDIGRFGEVGFEALKAVGLRGVLFQETEFSPEDRTAREDMAKLIRKVDDLRARETDLVTIGISPHAPYTVSPELFRMISRHAILEGLKLSIHASESSDEEELVRHGTGYFTQMYQKYGVTWQSPGVSPVAYLAELGVLKARPLLAHCVTVSDHDLELIRQSGSAIAHCPKSNAKFGHGFAPFEQFLDAKIPVGLGSDSVASNNTCDLLEEARFCVLAARNRSGSRRFITAGEVLRTATLGGAKAMGMDDKIGSLDPGKEADIAVFALSAPAQQPLNSVENALVFSTNARDAVMTMVAGKEVYRSPQVR